MNWIKLVELLPFYKGDNFCDFMFDFLNTKPQRENFFFLLKLTIFQMGSKTHLTELSPLKMHLFLLNERFTILQVFHIVIDLEYSAVPDQTPRSALDPRSWPVHFVGHSA